MARPVEVSWLGNLKTEARIGPHRLLVDEPTGSLDEVNATSVAAIAL